MSVAYFDDSRAATRPAVPAKPAKPRGFWRRMLDRIVEVRMAQARRELERHGVLDHPQVAGSWHHHVGG